MHSLDRAIKVHIDEIRPGDVIFHNGDFRTVTKGSIKNCLFMGKTLFGDNYRSGTKAVTKWTPPIWFNGKLLNT